MSVTHPSVASDSPARDRTKIQKLSFGKTIGDFFSKQKKFLLGVRSALSNRKYVLYLSTNKNSRRLHKTILMSESQNIEYKKIWKDEFSCKMSANQTCLSLPNRNRKTREA